MTLNTADRAVQIHCLRHACAENFQGTLQAIRNLGIHLLEMCSFPGCAGNPWGDFGELGNWTGVAVRDCLDETGLTVMGCHFPEKEFDAANLPGAIAWTRALGTTAMVLPSVSLPKRRTIADWQRAMATLNTLGEQLASEGMQLVYHTQVEAWEVLEGTRVFPLIAGELDASACRLEVDPSGAVLSGDDWLEALKSLDAGTFALHLRDAARDQCIGGAYLPSLTLGEGEMGWAQALPALQTLDLGRWVLEMETLDPGQALTALRDSIRFLDQMAVDTTEVVGELG